MSTVVLLSGGIDSLVCAELMRQRGDLTGCVFVDYGHPCAAPRGMEAVVACRQRCDRHGRNAAVHRGEPGRP
jgi:7-cyano-7-deazaguanine synthase in queuosine biosynthesis